MTGNKVYHWRVLVPWLRDEISHLCVSQCNEGRGGGGAGAGPTFTTVTNTAPAPSTKKWHGSPGKMQECWAMGMWEHYNIFLFIQKGYDSLSNILVKCLLFIFPLAAVQVGAV